MAQGRARRLAIPRRRRVFVGCEGESERGYAAFLQRLADDRSLGLGLHLHLDAVVLQPGAGGPLALIKRCREKLRRNELLHGRYQFRAALLDRSGFGQDARTAEQAWKLGQELGLRLILQDPDHEGFLLRHLPNCQSLRPPHDASMAALKERWPEYEKPMNAGKIAAKISYDDVRRTCAVDTGLRAFLTEIGFPL
jgi:hypothetical protein